MVLPFFVDTDRKNFVDSECKWRTAVTKGTLFWLFHRSVCYASLFLNISAETETKYPIMRR